METVLFPRWRGEPQGRRRRTGWWPGQVRLTRRVAASGKQNRFHLNLKGS